MTVNHKIEQVLQKRGKRLTPPRRLVLAALIDQKTALTAYELVDRIGQNIKPMSVYRALDVLTEAGLVHRIESLNAYVFCAEDHCAHQDSQYMVCGVCKGVEEIHNHDLDHAFEHALSDKGFTIQKKVIEVHGVCGRCG